MSTNRILFPLATMPNTFKLQKCKCEEKRREETRENGIYYLHGRLPISFLSYARDVQRCDQPTNQPTKALRSANLKISAAATIISLLF
jgi:hypothetical protein